MRPPFLFLFSPTLLFISFVFIHSVIAFYQGHNMEQGPLGSSEGRKKKKGDRLARKANLIHE